MQSRRDILRMAAGAVAPNILPATSLSVLVGAGPAQALDPATIGVATAAVNTIAAFMSAGGSSGLDPASQAYFERILANQELIASQIADINGQIEDLAKAVTLIAPQTVSLDKQIQAKGVYHSATGLELSFLRAILQGKSTFGDDDRGYFTGQVELLSAAASQHLALVEDVGQSIDTIVAIDALRLALGALINTARQAGFTGDADKKALLRAHVLISKAAERINSGAFATRMENFRSARARIRKDIIAAADALALAKVTKFPDYEFEITPASILEPLPAEIVGKFRFLRQEIREEVVGETILESGLLLPQDYFSGAIRTYTIDVQDEKRAIIRKKKLSSVDDNPAYFIIDLDPPQEGVPFLTLVNAFNEAMHLDNLLHAAEAVLARTLRATEPVAAEIEAL